MNSQFMRRYRVLIIDMDGATALDVSNLHCTFSVEKAIDEEPNYAQVEIINLSPETESQIVNSGKTVILEAGYMNGEYGMIYTGEIVQPLRKKIDNVTSSLLLICQDGDIFLNSAFVASSLQAGSSQDELLHLVDIKTGAVLGSVTAKLNKTQSVRGITTFGSLSDYISRIAKSIGAQMYVEDGKVNIIAAEDYDESTAVELNPYTGLIGTPEQTDDGISCQCLINPRIKLNTLIHINSGYVQQKQVASGETAYDAISADGVYRVYKIAISGDTLGTDWYMTLDAVTQTGAKPVGLSGDETNLWR